MVDKIDISARKWSRKSDDNACFSIDYRSMSARIAGLCTKQVNDFVHDLIRMIDVPHTRLHVGRDEDVRLKSRGGSTARRDPEV